MPTRAEQVASTMLNALREVDPTNFSQPPYISEENKRILVETHLEGNLQYVDEVGNGIADGEIETTENTFIIRIPSHTPPIRDIFTIAHEIGHLFLHLGYGSEDFEAGRHYRENTDDYDAQRENEANQFAAAFLMPEEEFRNKYTDLNGDIGSIARHFGVSGAAATTRAKFLHLMEW